MLLQRVGFPKVEREVVGIFMRNWQSFCVESATGGAKEYHVCSSSSA